MVAAILATTLATSGGAVFAPSARAQSAELREARDHFRRGKEAYSAQRFEDAYREFEAGYRLSSRPLFLFNMGHARRRAGALGEARALFRRFLELQPDSPRRAEVEAILRELEPPPPPPPPAPPPPAITLSLPASPPPPSVVTVLPHPPAESPPSPRRWWLW